MSIKKIITNSAQEMQEVAKNLAKEILELKSSKNAIVLALSGDLGAGKTTFLQGFAKGMGINEKINSPTFVIMKRFDIKGVKFKNFYHIDCYRLDSSKDILDLGFKEIILNPENIVAIEWPEKIYPVEFGKAKILTKSQNYSTGVKLKLPKNSVKIKFGHLEAKKREISIDNF